MAKSGRDLAAELTAARAAEYEAIAAEAKAASELDGPARRAARKRLQAELDRIDKRTYFPTAQRKKAHTTVKAIAVEP